MVILITKLKKSGANEMNNYFYNQFFTLKELFEGNFQKVMDKANRYFTLLDNVSMDDKVKIDSLISLIYGELLDNPSDKIYTRYIKYDDKGNELKPERYNNELAKKLYQSFLPLWQQKQLYNASMNWENLEKLLSDEKTRTLKNVVDGISKTEADSNTDLSSSSGEYNAGLDKTNIDNLNPNYLNTGSKQEGKNKNSVKGNTDSKTNQDLTESIKYKDSKIKYLKELNNIIKENQFTLTDSYWEFINSIIIPNQNIEFNPFPWPWRFNSDYQ